MYQILPLFYEVGEMKGKDLLMLWLLKVSMTFSIEPPRETETASSFIILLDPIRHFLLELINFLFQVILTSP